MSAVTAGMHHPFRDAFVIEVEDLVAKVGVLDQRRSALANPQCVLVVGDRRSQGSRENRRVGFRDLVQFAAISARGILIVHTRRFGS